MRGGIALWQLAKADFLDRVRRHSFLVTLGVTAFVGYVAVPGPDANYSVLSLGDYRLVYNSAGVGFSVAVFTTLTLALAGFYLVSDALARDRRTGVGQIIAATPVSRWQYLLGKALSTYLTLLLLVAVMVVAAAIMQVARGEGTGLHAGQLAAPFLYATVPAMAVVAAVAVVFESVRILRGGFGNVLYFFLYGAGLMLPIANLHGARVPAVDITGVGYLFRTVLEAFQTALPMQTGAMLSAGITSPAATKTFLFTGTHWGLVPFAARLWPFGLACGLIGLTALLFDPFGEERVSPARRPRTLRPDSAAIPAIDEAETVLTASAESVGGRLRPVAASRFRLWSMVREELRLMVYRRSLWWYVVAAAFVLVPVVAPGLNARQWLAPAWLWPLLLWSGMGAREAQHRTEAMVFSGARSVRHQGLALWLAGVIVALATGSGAGLRLLLEADGAGVTGWLVGALFIPSLALACGILSGGSKLFEAVYTGLWYVGPVSGLPALDFIGVTGHSQAGVWVLVSFVLFVAATVGRWRQVYRA